MNILVATLILASELMTVIYEAVEILGGLAITVLIISFITHKIKKSKEPKVYETELDKEKELKMILKDEKRNKEIVKGALSTKSDKAKKKERRPVASVNKQRPSQHHKPRQDKEISAPKKRRSSSYSSKSGHYKDKNKEIRIPKSSKKLPGRDTRIQILNKLSNNQAPDKSEKEKEEKNGRNKFYDITNTDD